LEIIEAMSRLIATCTLDLIIFSHWEKALRLVMKLTVPIYRVIALVLHKTLVSIGVYQVADFLLCEHTRLEIVLLLGYLLSAVLHSIRVFIREFTV
jgi:hypothetical protein